MRPRRGSAVAIALLGAALAAAGCGLGPGAGVGSVALTVSREFGTVPMLERSLGGTESDTVMRLLESSARISTRYGGGYVQSIDGVEETQRDGHPYDWFFYVDGVESPIGAADSSVRGGERIWWDYHDWSASEGVPAVVGSWPAPFAAGYEGRRHPVALECEGGGGACGTVRRALAGAGAEFGAGAAAIRVLVGPWARLRSDPTAALLEQGPAESGVFAEFTAGGGGFRLRGLDENGDPGRRFGPGAGLVAATRRYESPPVWLVTGATPAAVAAAAGALDAADLRDRYAVAVEGGTAVPLPEVPPGAGAPG
jgi:hypothetical protein